MMTGHIGSIENSKLFYRKIDGLHPWFLRDLVVKTPEFLKIPSLTDPCDWVLAKPTFDDHLYGKCHVNVM